MKLQSLVYYPSKPPESETIEALVYRIKFDILYEYEGRASSVSSVEYEYANYAQSMRMPTL